jgi:hypothetical protein
LERETAEFLSKATSEVVQSVRDLGVVVTAVVADNAKNIQKGLQLSSQSGFIVGQCFAHTLNLLLEDLAKIFSRQFEQMAQVEVFFRIRYNIIGWDGVMV